MSFKINYIMMCVSCIKFLISKSYLITLVMKSKQNCKSGPETYINLIWLPSAFWPQVLKIEIFVANLNDTLVPPIPTPCLICLQTSTLIP